MNRMEAYHDNGLAFDLREGKNEVDFKAYCKINPKGNFKPISNGTIYKDGHLSMIVSIDINNEIEMEKIKDVLCSIKNVAGKIFR